MEISRRRRTADRARVADGTNPAPEPAPAGVVPTNRSPAKSTRTSAAWASLAVGLVLLIVLLVFILQNLHTVRVSFFWVHWRIPLAVDLLFATVLGGLIVFTAGSLRMLQLRRTARRQAKQHERHHIDEA